MIPVIILLITSNIYTIMYYSKLLERSRNDNKRLQARIEKLTSKNIKFSSDDNLNNIINQALKEGKTHIKLNDKSRLKYPSRIKND